MTKPHDLPNPRLEQEKATLSQIEILMVEARASLSEGDDYRAFSYEKDAQEIAKAHGLDVPHLQEEEIAEMWPVKVARFMTSARNSLSEGYDGGAFRNEKVAQETAKAHGLPIPHLQEEEIAKTWPVKVTRFMTIARNNLSEGYDERAFRNEKVAQETAKAHGLPIPHLQEEEIAKMWPVKVAMLMAIADDDLSHGYDVDAFLHEQQAQQIAKSNGLPFPRLGQDKIAKMWLYKVERLMATARRCLSDGDWDRAFKDEEEAQRTAKAHDLPIPCLEQKEIATMWQTRVEKLMAIARNSLSKGDNKDALLKEKMAQETAFAAGIPIPSLRAAENPNAAILGESSGDSFELHLLIASSINNIAATQKLIEANEPRIDPDDDDCKDYLDSLERSIKVSLCRRFASITALLLSTYFKIPGFSEVKLELLHTIDIETLRDLMSPSLNKEVADLMAPLNEKSDGRDVGDEKRIH
ncbi:hypothetical protein EIK77_000815 [Talaromyces pinophilus]|nr:hypothetical protein EIK77_000938 [Talaromyces pinophilus]KAI7969251.1 hypothetical protein EIK77_005261 [Talaromyces pinophilus]KAI7972759.1 hypothetical protein EIK77_005451 [Talaromyces pinophilus]KAI7975020.1 hypothetical protein EIK77_000815 [Talaromyces pinophilus]